MELKPLSIFFGGISNTCKTYGEEFQHDAPGFGFQVHQGVRNLDEAVENLPTDRPVLIITSSYEGQPPDNAKGFVAWLETRAAAGNEGLLEAVNYAVFGAGNKDWVRTFHRIPKLIDSLMEKLGATRIAPIGLVDVSEDILGPWEDWKTGLIPVLRRLSGATAVVTAEEMTVEIIHPEAPTRLAGSEVTSGIVLSNTEVVKAGVGPQKKHMEVLLPPGQSYQSGDYLVVLPVNPREQIRRVMNRFGLHPDDLLAVMGTSKEYLAGFVSHCVLGPYQSPIPLCSPDNDRRMNISSPTSSSAPGSNLPRQPPSARSPPWRKGCPPPSTSRHSRPTRANTAAASSRSVSLS